MWSFPEIVMSPEVMFFFLDMCITTFWKSLNYKFKMSADVLIQLADGHLASGWTSQN